MGAKALWGEGGGWQLVPSGRGATRSTAELGCDLPSWQGAEGGIIIADEVMKPGRGLVGMVGVGACALHLTSLPALGGHRQLPGFGGAVGAEASMYWSSGQL